MYRFKTQADVILAALQIMETRAKRYAGSSMSSVATSAAYFQMRIGALEHETFSVVYLDNQHRLIEAEDLFRGTVDSAAVYPRELAKRCLQTNAAAVIIAHNHPSGFVEPSNQDREITRKLKQALDLLDVRLLDHIVVTANDYVSLAERGLI